MNWFTWRQLRKPFFIFAVLIAAYAAFAIPTGLHYWHAYQNALANCSLNSSCDNIADQIFSSGSAQLTKNAVFMAGLFGPLLLGLFLGSALVAREYEEGTNKLAWTQSLSRRKWLTTRISWALGFALLYGLAISLLTTYWSRAANAAYQNRFDPGIFDIQGLMPIANSLLLTAVGFSLGAWFRKTMVAMAVTLGFFVALQVTFAQVIRQHYMTAVSATSPMGPNAIFERIPQGAWVLSRDLVDKNGKVFDSFGPTTMPQQCQQIIEQSRAGDGRAIAVKPGASDSIDDCLNKAGYHQLARFQPSYRYWDFQRIEAGIYLGITALAVAATYWLVQKRDA